MQLSGILTSRCCCEIGSGCWSRPIHGEKRASWKNNPDFALQAVFIGLRFVLRILDSSALKKHCVRNSMCHATGFDRKKNIRKACWSEHVVSEHAANVDGNFIDRCHTHHARQESHICLTEYSLHSEPCVAVIADIPWHSLRCLSGTKWGLSYSAPCGAPHPSHSLALRWSPCSSRWRPSWGGVITHVTEETPATFPPHWPCTLGLISPIQSPKNRLGEFKTTSQYKAGPAET